jgi:hypothetical protein
MSDRVVGHIEHEHRDIPVYVFVVVEKVDEAFDLGRQAWDFQPCDSRSRIRAWAL